MRCSLIVASVKGGSIRAMWKGQPFISNLLFRDNKNVQNGLIALWEHLVLFSAMLLVFGLIIIELSNRSNWVGYEPYSHIE